MFFNTIKGNLGQALKDPGAGGQMPQAPQLNLQQLQGLGQSFGGGRPPQAPQPNPPSMRAMPPMNPFMASGSPSPGIRPMNPYVQPDISQQQLLQEATALGGKFQGGQPIVGPAGGQSGEDIRAKIDAYLAAKNGPTATPPKTSQIPNTFDPGNGGHLTRSLISRQSPYSYQDLFGDTISPQALEWLRLYDSGQGG